MVCKVTRGFMEWIIENLDSLFCLNLLVLHVSMEIIYFQSSSFVLLQIEKLCKVYLKQKENFFCAEIENKIFKLFAFYENKHLARM